MAEVKLKNGYLRISVSLFENLYFRNFSKREQSIISLIVRLSYGYHKKTAIIKPKTWFTVCGLYQPDISKTLGGLVDKKVIKDLGNNTYSLNKNYDEWLVEYPKNFNAEKLNILKMIQQSKQNTIKNNSETLSKDIVKDYEEVGQNTIKNDSETLSHSKTLSNNIVNHYGENLEIEQNTIKNNSETLSKDIVKDYIENTENTQGKSDLDGYKDNKDNKDNKDITNNNIYNKLLNKNYDPYFNNPYVEKFKKEYERIFNKPRCFLNNFQINKIIEICTSAPEFFEKMPEILVKMKKIKFSQGSTSLKWLLESGNWAGILNGEFDKYIEDEIQEKCEVQESWKL